MLSQCENLLRVTLEQTDELSATERVFFMYAQQMGSVAQRSTSANAASDASESSDNDDADKHFRRGPSSRPPASPRSTSSTDSSSASNNSLSHSSLSASSSSRSPSLSKSSSDSNAAQGSVSTTSSRASSVTGTKPKSTTLKKRVSFKEEAVSNQKYASMRIGIFIPFVVFGFKRKICFLNLVIIS